METPYLALLPGGELGAVVEDRLSPGGVLAAVGHALREALVFVAGLGYGVKVAAIGQGAVAAGVFEVVKAAGGRLRVPVALAGAAAVGAAVGALHSRRIPFHQTIRAWRTGLQPAARIA